MSKPTAVVAFSGGLDTSFLVPFAREQYGIERIITCTVDTGGFGPEQRVEIEQRANEVGSDEHVFIEAETDLYNQILKYLIFGNATRDGYPMCVGSERYVQAEHAIRCAIDRGAQYLFHGSTGAGNDQYRFDSAIHVLGQGNVTGVAPVREHNKSREESTAYLRERGITVSDSTTQYSYNVGLWGVSIGGAETHSSTGLIPDEAWYSQVSATEPSEVRIEFQCGELAAVTCGDDSATGPVDCIKMLSKLGSAYGIGRHYYTGTSIPGKKGRLAYESPAADIIYAAHRCLEQITLSQAQIFAKKPLSDDFGRLVHEAKMYDPFFGDLKAFLTSTQKRVTGSVTVTLEPYRISHPRAESPNDLLGLKGAVYGEVSEFYTGKDAESAAKLNAFEQVLWRSVDTDND